jgi:uncharacterized protein YdcH (DUF465 family)
MDIESTLLNKLVSENNEFKSLYDEHNDLKNQVDALNNRKFLTPEQEIEKKNLQKQKLIKKDRLMEIVGENQPSTT